MTIAVRHANLDDVEALVVMNRFIQDLHLAHRPDSFNQTDEMSVAGWFNSMLGNTAVRTWIAESGGRPAGYALTIVYDRPAHAFCPARRFCEIDHIAVVPACRRKGVARALVEHVLEDARTRRIYEIELTSWCFNLEAHEAFRALGFSEKTLRFERKIPAQEA